ncbi:MAG: AmmeMemoRadiSam system radical SAM enzyme [Salinivirgaceae bacterium]|nr:AmmeMemoRadiSam system radical SAM enzyme [Salinivirgaceae bacterium]
MFYQKVKRNVQCNICPHECILHEGKVGVCGVRRNLGGKIRCLNYGLVSSVGFDPIEKKPLYHFYPGKEIFSIGSMGCNLSCNFCQNWEISQNCQVENLGGNKYEIKELIAKAKSNPNNIGIAFTYNEPTVGFEFVKDVASKAQKEGLKTVMVSNGYINQKPLESLIEVIDAFNIDLKAFTESFYVEMSGGQLAPVLESLKIINKHKRHLEITFLVIPNKNDSVEIFKEMVSWICNELGENTVLHLSRYFPRYKQNQPFTSNEKLIELFNVAKERLNFVYIGNAPELDKSNTLCLHCNTVLIKRERYNTMVNYNWELKTCPECNKPVEL